MFFTDVSCWEIGSRKYSGFLRYDLSRGLVTVFFNPYESVNHLTILAHGQSVWLSFVVKVCDASSFTSRTLDCFSLA